MSSASPLPPFGKKNYIFVLAGIVAIVAGYLLMGTEDFVDATKFSIALHVCPFIILAGFISVGYGIMIKPPHAIAEEEETQQ